MQISDMRFYGSSRETICRLGLTPLFLELQQTLLRIDVRVFNQKHANSAGAVRGAIDAELSLRSDWLGARSNGVDWIARFRHEQWFVSRLGVDLPLSAPSDLLARDIVHIRNSLQDSDIDVGVIVVPSDEFEFLLTDRVANFSYAVRYVEEELREARTYPIVLMACEHYGFSDVALPKKITNRGKK